MWSWERNVDAVSLRLHQGFVSTPFLYWPPFPLLFHAISWLWVKQLHWHTHTLITRGSELRIFKRWILSVCSDYALSFEWSCTKLEDHPWASKWRSTWTCRIKIVKKFYVSHVKYGATLEEICWSRPLCQSSLDGWAFSPFFENWLLSRGRVEPDKLCET